MLLRAPCLIPLQALLHPPSSEHRSELTSELRAPSSTLPSSEVFQTDDEQDGGFQYRAISVAKLQKEDVGVGVVVRLCLQQADEPTHDQMRAESSITKALWAQWSRLVVLNGVVYRTDFGSQVRPQCNQLLVPTVMRDELIRSCHTGKAGSHLGVKKTLDQVRR